MKKNTCLDYAILGLLCRQSLSGYGIRKVFETTALGNYSSSPGTIYPALKRLSQLELIYQLVSPKGFPGSKKVFCIHPNGINKLKEWVRAPIKSEDIIKRIKELLLRFAFMDNLVEEDQKVQFLESFIKEIKQYQKKLEQNYKEKYNMMNLHGRLALENGIEVYKAHLRWARKALKAINSE